MTTAAAPAPSKTKSKLPLVAAYTQLAKGADLLQSPFLLFIRIYIGWQCMVSGVGHLHNFDKTVEAFQGWNVPAPHLSVALSAATEIVGGGLLLLGFATRLVSIALIGNFVVAFLAVNLSNPTYHKQLLNLWNDQTVLLNDTAFPFLATAIITFLFGPGLFSIDGIFKKIKH